MSMPITQLESMRSLAENWDGYGAAAPQEHLIDLAGALVNLLEGVLKNRLATPDDLHVNPTRTGGILIEWEDAAMQHEVELSPDQSFSFLHLNKATGNIETRKLSPGPRAVVHPGLLRELSQLLAA
jgi:hypothetical protein